MREPKEGLPVKTTVNNVASVAIIYPSDDPRKVFLCEYDQGYPSAVFRGMYNPPGGNWIGPLAASDSGPRDTIERELKEELVLLGRIRSYIQRALRPWGSYYHLVPKAVFDSADPQNKRGDTSTFVCCWIAPLGTKVWFHLGRLQAKYGNLTNEGYTRITSFDEVLDGRRRFAWGHSQEYKDFWNMHGLRHRTPSLSRNGDITSEYAGPVPETYKEVLRYYHVLRTPFTT